MYSSTTNTHYLSTGFLTLAWLLPMVVLQSTWLTRRECLLIYKVQVASLTQLGQSPINNPSPGIGSLIVSASACAALRLHPIQLLLPDCVCFSYYPRSIVFASATTPRLCLLQLLLPDCVCFSYYPRSIVFASATTPQLCLLQVLLPNCVCFDCCSQLCPRQLLLPVFVSFSLCCLLAIQEGPSPCPKFSVQRL